MFTERFFICDYNKRISDVLNKLGRVVTLEIDGNGISFSGGKPVRIIGYKKEFCGEVFNLMDIESNGVYFIPYPGDYVKTLEMPNFELRSRHCDWRDIRSADLMLICDRVESGQYYIILGDFHREFSEKKN